MSDISKPPHTTNTCIMTWIYLLHFTSSFSILRVARRDWSCWNLRMSSPFTGGCTEIWHTWKNKEEIHGQWSGTWNYNLLKEQGGDVTSGLNRMQASKFFFNCRANHSDFCQMNADSHTTTASKQTWYQRWQCQPNRETLNTCWATCLQGEN